jgi:hypothetical protein
MADGCTEYGRSLFPDLRRAPVRGAAAGGRGVTLPCGITRDVGTNKADSFDANSITIPFAISVFPGEPYQAPPGRAKRVYPTTSPITASLIGAGTLRHRNGRNYFKGDGIQFQIAAQVREQGAFTPNPTSGPVATI